MGETPTFIKHVDFGECLKKLVVDGGKFKRSSWGESKAYITIRDGKLVVFDVSDDLLHPCVVSEGDIMGTDWIRIAS